MADMTFGVLGVIGSVIQVYGTVEKAYDTYIKYADFSFTYEKLRMALFIERQRLEIFKDKVLKIQASPDRYGQDSATEYSRWLIMEWIFRQILESFQKSNQKMESCGQYVGITPAARLSDDELLKIITAPTKPTPRHSFSSMIRKFKFVVRDKPEMEQTIKQLSIWNDQLTALLPPIEVISCKRSLRTQLSTQDTEELGLVSQAAESLEHWDIVSMARARGVIELGQQEELEYLDMSGAATPLLVENPPVREIKMAQMDFAGKNPFPTDAVRQTALYKGDSVIVDWRCCQDDSWRKKNPKAFRQRTEDLTNILNSDLRPLNLAILHCVGYFDQGSRVTGYAFKPPEEASPNDQSINLKDFFDTVRSPDHVPDLGDRYEMAKALVSTIFEIHNLGWMHKNIQPANILLWPNRGTQNINLARPYLVGFDISRPNRPEEKTEKPRFQPSEDVYRHPQYKSQDAVSFRPSFDVYSLGVLLWEIGRWRKFVNLPTKRIGHPDPPADPKLLERSISRGDLVELKRLTGTKYQKVVETCLSQKFDRFWKDGDDPEGNLRTYLDEFQQQVVEPLALCSA